MKKVIILLLCILFGLVQQANNSQQPPHDGKETGKPLTYRFHYTFLGQTSGMFLFIFRYRMFFFADGSVFLEARREKDHALRFHFSDIDTTGYIQRTWGFSGKTLITAAADYDLKKADAILDKDLELLKEKDENYARVIKRRKQFSFLILSKKKDAITFKREIDGRHLEAALNMPLKRVKYDHKFGIYVKIYDMLVEMVKIHNHAFYPGKWEQISQLKPGTEWQSPPLDFSRNINRIGGMATVMIEKYVTFRQRKPIILNYHVESRTAGVLTVRGKAEPLVKIFGSFKVATVNRTIKIRLADGILLEDTFDVKIRNHRGKGGFARCELKLVQ